MTLVQGEVTTVCDTCNGVIPVDADRIGITHSLAIINGEPVIFESLHFCCTEHASEYLSTHGDIPVPDPPYEPLLIDASGDISALPGDLIPQEVEPVPEPLP